MANRLSKPLPSYYRKRRAYRREIFGWLHAALRRSETIDVLCLPTPTLRVVEKRLIAQYKAIGQTRWREAQTTDLRTLGEVTTLNRPRIQTCVIWITSHLSRSGDTVAPLPHGEVVVVRKQHNASICRPFLQHSRRHNR